MKILYRQFRIKVNGYAAHTHLFDAKFRSTLAKYGSSNGQRGFVKGNHRVVQGIPAAACGQCDHYGWHLLADICKVF